MGGRALEAFLKFIDRMVRKKRFRGGSSFVVVRLLGPFAAVLARSVAVVVGGIHDDDGG